MFASDKLIGRIRTATNILYEEIPEIDSPALRPTRYVKKPQPPEETDRNRKVRELEDVLGLRSSKKRASAPALPEIKIPILWKRDERWSSAESEINRHAGPTSIQNHSDGESVAQFREMSSLLSSLAGPREFMQMVRPEVFNLMREHRRTRMILI